MNRIPRDREGKRVSEEGRETVRKEGRVREGGRKQGKEGVEREGGRER